MNCGEAVRPGISIPRVRGLCHRDTTDADVTEREAAGDVRGADVALAVSAAQGGVLPADGAQALCYHRGARWLGWRPRGVSTITN